MLDEDRNRPQATVLHGLDRVIHEPARLAIMARLYVLDEADWLFLHRQTGLSFGNLTSHLARLEAAGYAEVEKTFIDRRPHTVVRMTGEGREAFERYRQRMRDWLEPVEM